MVDRKHLARWTTLLAPLLVAAFWLGVAERPFRPAAPAVQRSQRAAIAIRDDVPAFQKWGTTAFTLPALRQGYGRVVYLVQSPREDQRRAFVAAMADELAGYQEIDLFLLAHTNDYVDWLADLAPADRAKLRLVYNTGCYNVEQAARWLDQGADLYVGHPGLSQSPVFFFYFLRRWNQGLAADEAMAASNRRMADIIGWEALLTAGAVDPDRAYAESEASCAGDCDLTLGGAP